MFEIPNFELPAVLFTAFGVVLLWARLGHNQIRIFALSKLVDQLPCSKNTALVLELVVFSVIGVIVAISFIKPTSAAQAIAAGMGWTGLLSEPNYNRSE